MKKLMPMLCLVCAAVAWSTAVPAQMTSDETTSPDEMSNTTPPKVLWLFREDVKPARGLSHQQVERQFASYWAKNGAAPFFALDALTGNATDVLFISGYPSWEALQKDQQNFDKASSGPTFTALEKQEAELVNGVKGTLAGYRDDMSYRPERVMKDLAQARYVVVMTFRVKPGHEMDFVENERTVVKSHADANMDEAWLMYDVAAGAPMGTFLYFQPLKSLSEITEIEAIHKTYRDGLSGEIKLSMKKHAEEDIVMAQRDVYSMNPKESHPPKDIVAAAPDFWGQKELPMAGRTQKKADTKTAVKKSE